MVDLQGTVWASTRNGLFRKPAAALRFEQMFPPETQADEAFHMAAMDRNGQVWAAGEHGLARLAGGRWTRFTTRNGLKSDNVAHVVEDPDGSLWIGYYDA